MSIPSWSGVSYTSVGRKIKRIIDQYPGDQSVFYITSSHRPHTPGSHHGGKLSYGGSRTSAVDIGFDYPNNKAQAKKMANWLMGKRGNMVELIHSPSHYVKNTRKTSPYAVSTHYNHIHVAMSSKQADRLLNSLGAGGGGGGGGGGLPDPLTSVRSIKEQQRAVNRTSIDPKLKLDGIWGPNTYSGVKFLQRMAGTKDDGLWGPKTESAYDDYIAEQKRKRNEGDSSSGGGGGSSYSGSGPMTSIRSVKEQQRAVNRTSIDPKLKLDGIWGPKTENGVRFLQRMAGTKDDGLWGPKTESAYKDYIAEQKRKRENNDDSGENNNDSSSNDRSSGNHTPGATVFNWFTTGG